MTQTSPDTFAAFIGIDWADAKQLTFAHFC